MVLPRKGKLTEFEIHIRPEEGFWNPVEVPFKFVFTIPAMYSSFLAYTQLNFEKCKNSVQNAVVE